MFFLKISFKLWKPLQPGNPGQIAPLMAVLLHYKDTILLDQYEQNDSKTDDSWEL